MSEEQNQQAVADTPNAGAQPPATGADARDQGDEYDALLSQFDATQTPKAEPKPTPEQAKGTAPIDKQSLKAEIRAEIDADNQFKADVDRTIKAIRGDIDPEIADDVFVRAYLDAAAEADPRLAQAFRERHAKPKEFAKITEQLGKKFASKFSKLPNREATEDREAVTEAIVRGSQQQAPEAKAPDFSRMTDREFSETAEKKFGIRI